MYEEKTVTISLKLKPSEAEKLEELARETSCKKSVILRLGLGLLLAKYNEIHSSSVGYQGRTYELRQINQITKEYGIDEWFSW